MSTTLLRSSLSRLSARCCILRKHRPNMWRHGSNLRSTYFSTCLVDPHSDKGHKAQPRRGILEQLNAGELIVGDGGMTYALEKRGYVKAGVWTPECTVEHPEAVRQLHREFLRAGADVIQAFTFSLKADSDGDKQNDNGDDINQAACDLAKSVAAEGGALFAGSICQTGTMYSNGAGKQAVQKRFQQQSLIFLKNNADFLIAEFFEFVEEAVWAVEVMKSTGLPVAVTMCIGPNGDHSGVASGDCAVKLARAGADIVGVNCRFDPTISLETCQLMKEALDREGLNPFLMVQPIGYHSPDCRHTLLGFSTLPELPFALEPRLLTRWEVHKFARQAYDMGIRYIGGCCGFEPYHIRAIAEELSPERGGRLPPASAKHSLWGNDLQYYVHDWMKHKSTRTYWENLVPATGRPKNPALSEPTGP